MTKNYKSEKTETFGFDFCSVYEEQIDAASHAECTGCITNEYRPNIEELPSAEEIVTALHDASEEILRTIPDPVDDEDDGLTAADILARGQKANQEACDRSFTRSKSELRELEDQLSIERTLRQILERTQIAVNRGIIWAAALDEQIWIPLQTEAQVSTFLHRLGIRRYGNTVRWFSNRISGDPTFKVSGFFETANLWGKVSFADGLLDIRTGKFRERSLEDRVTAVLSLPYQDIDSPSHYDRLREAMKSLAETEESYLRLQEVCGVALHAEPCGRILYFQHHNPRVASIFTKLLAKTWSDDSVSFLGLRDHERSFRTAQVLEHPIVISGKEGESTLHDISTVLALVDGDGVNTDRKHLDPFDFQSRCSMICAGRNLPSLSKSSMQTLRYYLIRVNLTGDLPEGFSIRDLLSYVKAFTAWSLEGLQRYILSNGHFTFDEGSDIPREDASIVDFVQEMIVNDPHGKMPANALHKAYSDFCARNNLTALPKPRLVSYLRDTFRLESRTIRVSWYNEGNPVFGYVGIRFSEEYLSLLDELSEDACDSDGWPHASEDEEDDETEYEDWKPDFEPCGELIF